MHPTISEETQDLIMSSDGETPGPYNPPPHIAARIYRNAANRRKSSAASSRRNSMSSHHSSRSTRSAHGGPQSTHVAQHLRRASIIQSRKDKAADRNAHAEKVRLRAAMVKAAPRVTTNNSEERAIAAQQARERYLAQVKANCAEEVKRSKRVAEEQREKRAAEHLKLKEDMEERHAEAERRKALLDQKMRRTRTASLPTVEEKKTTTYVWKPRNHDEAACIIQRGWRNRQRKNAIRDFLGLGLTVELIQRTTFEEVGALLAQEKVLACTQKMLEVCGLTNNDDDDPTRKTAVRTFLSTFLLLGHPAQVLSKDGDQEKDLVDKARELLLRFNRIIEIDDTTRSLLSVQLKELSEAYVLFQKAFHGWKSQDSYFLVTNMVAQFVELDAIWQTVKDDTNGAVAEDYREGIQQNQTLVLARLKRLAGPEKAMKMIKDAVRASRKTRAKKKSVPDSRPRTTSVDLTQAPTPADLPLANTATSSVEPPSALSEDNLPAERKHESFSLLPDNRTLMHELAINKEYKLDIQSQIAKREAVVEAVRSNMQQGLDLARPEIVIPSIARKIQERLLRLLTPGNSLHVLISDALDPQLVANQVKNNAFSYDKFFSFMNTILPKICAPVRDGEVKDLSEKPSQDPVQQLARIYYVIDLLLLDHMNFILMSHAPKMLEGSVIWEQREFKKRLGGQEPLKTMAWWKAAVARANEEPPRRMIGGTTPRITPDRIYMHGLVDLAISTTALSEADVPETLELDWRRLDRIRSDTLRMITTASILLTAKNLLRRDVRSLWKNESQRMWELPYSSPASAFVSIVESRYALPPSTKTQLTGTITRLLSDAREYQVTHPVMKVLLKKIQGHVLSRLAAASSEERIRTSTTASEVLGSSGMPEYVARIGDIVQELSKVADVDREAHGRWYDEVAQKVAKETGEAHAENS